MVSGISSTDFPHAPKAGCIFFISLGILIPNLCVRTQYLDLTLEIIWFLSLVVFGTHRESWFVSNADSDSVFGNLHRVVFLRILEGYPSCAVIFPLK
jgi:hypothetical protein